MLEVSGLRKGVNTRRHGVLGAMLDSAFHIKRPEVRECAFYLVQPQPLSGLGASRTFNLSAK